MSNTDIANHLSKLSLYYRINGDSNRSGAFGRASELIENYDGDYETDYRKVKIHGIGESTLSEVDEYLATGTSKRLESIKGDSKSKTVNIASFSVIPDLGIMGTMILHNKYGVNDIDDLKDFYTRGFIKDIGNSSILSILDNYFDVEKSKFPRGVALLAALEVTGLIEKYAVDLKLNVTGSLRRGATSVKDVDLVISTNNWEKVSTEIRSNYKVIYGGASKLHFEVPLKEIYNGRTVIEVDVVMAPPSEYYYSLLYLTGSKEFNIEMRRHCKNMSLRLNEHGLFDESGKLLNLDVSGEEDIFKYLGLRYCAPAGRLGASSIVPLN
jgi:DNA polymerase/3'-5' exonuclease PolX